MTHTTKPATQNELAHALAFSLPVAETPVRQLSHEYATRRGEAFPFHGTHIHGKRPATADSEIPAWFWLTFLALGAMALSLVCWGAYRSMNEEKFLRVADKASTLGLTGTKLAAGRNGDPEPVRVAQKEGPAVLPQLPVEPPPPPPLPVEPPPLLFKPNPVAELPTVPPVTIPVLPVVDETRPVVNLEALSEVDTHPLCYTRALPNEDTPMLRNWKMLALYSLTVVTLAQPAPTVAQDQKTLLDRFDNLEKAIKQSFELMKTDLVALNKSLATVEKMLGAAQADITILQGDNTDNKIKIANVSGKIDSLEKQLQKMQLDMDALRRRLDTEPRTTAPIIDKASVDEVKLKLSAIEKAILSLQPAKERVALSPGVTDSKGRVMLVNNYAETLLFIINGREFRIPAMTTQPIDGVPAGALDYEVISPTWGSRARRTTTLAVGETFTLTAQ